MTLAKMAGAGFRYMKYYLRNDLGFGLVPAQGADGYGGVQIELAKALTFNVPDAQIISHLGDDVVAQVDQLPPTEGLSAEFRTGMTNLAVDADLSRTNTVQIGEMTFGGFLTDQQGKHPTVWALAYRQSVDMNLTSPTAGDRRWFAVIIKCIIQPKAGSMEEQSADENSYMVTPRVFNSYPWGVLFEKSTENFLTTQLLRFGSQHRPNIHYWEGDGVVTDFLFPTDLQAISVDRITTWHYVLSTGVVTDVTSTETMTTAGPNFTVAPAAGDFVISKYEIPDDA